MASIEDQSETPEKAAPRVPVPPIVLLAGPTGVGKSDLALALAERFQGEILSADSRQVYRGLEIGTAQPSAAERARVPHHLVGILEPDEPFSVACFVDLADQALADLARRDTIAFVVGGTHHYVQALLDRLELPRIAPDPELRSSFARFAEQHGSGALHARLAEVDPVAASAIPTANVRRVIRALEVALLTGRPFSQQSRRRGEPLPALRLALTMPRPDLYARIDARVDRMLARGWLQETQALLHRGYPSHLPALTSTGYRELLGALRGEMTLDEAIQRVKYSTHAYVRRQYAWLRRDPRLIWLEQGPNLNQAAADLVQNYLAGATHAQPPTGDHESEEIR